MRQARMVVRRSPYGADQVQRVLDELESGRLGRGALQYRRVGEAFFLANEQPQGDAPPAFTAPAGS